MSFLFAVITFYVTKIQRIQIIFRLIAILLLILRFCTTVTMSARRITKTLARFRSLPRGFLRRCQGCTAFNARPINRRIIHNFHRLGMLSFQMSLKSTRKRGNKVSETVSKSHLVLTDLRFNVSEIRNILTHPLRSVVHDCTEPVTKRISADATLSKLNQ